jgi:hypothetical protein
MFPRHERNMSEGGERGWRLRASEFYQAAFQFAIQAKCRDDCRCFKRPEHRYLKKVDVAELSGLQQKSQAPDMRKYQLWHATARRLHTMFIVVQ